MQLPGAGKRIAFEQKLHQLEGAMVHDIRARLCDRRPDPDIAFDHRHADIGQVFHLHLYGAVTVEVPYLIVFAATVTQRLAQ
ncbi:hypothetical protein D3C87_1770910 [compost metagenome]